MIFSLFSKTRSFHKSIKYFSIIEKYAIALYRTVDQRVTCHGIGFTIKNDCSLYRKQNKNKSRDQITQYIPSDHRAVHFSKVISLFEEIIIQFTFMYTTHNMLSSINVRNYMPGCTGVLLVLRFSRNIHIYKYIYIYERGYVYACVCDAGR